MNKAKLSNIPLPTKDIFRGGSRATFKIATLQLCGCAGCHLALLDALKDLPQLVTDKTIEIKYSHMLMDEKELSEKVDLLIVEGAVATTHEEKILKKYANLADKIFALGGCACLRGIPTQANIFEKEDILKKVFVESSPSLKNKIPNNDLPEYFEFIHAVDFVVDVDYELVGCPPDAEEVRDALMFIINYKEPPSTSKCVCDECPRIRITDAEQVLTEPVKRIIDLIPNSKKCFVDQGLICLGKSTRSGCGAKCPKAGAPCWGCLGPIESWRQIAPSDGADFKKRVAFHEKNKT
jgi:F420-non-reducing hydrogenase small subunit